MEILLFLFVVAALVFYLTAEPAPTNIDGLDDPRYRAVKINPCENACQAATQTSQIIFLSLQAPKLPLNACDRIAECDCQFRHYVDRRQQEDRRATKRVGRRVSDHYNAA